MNQKMSSAKKTDDMIVDMNGKYHIEMPGVNLDGNFNAKVESTSNPKATHVNGSYEIMGKKLDMEAYVFDKKETYFKMSGLPDAPEGWHKSTNPPKELQFEDAPNQSKNSLEAIDKSYAAFKDDPDSYTIKKENGTYVVTFDSSKVKNPDQLREVLNMQLIKDLKMED
ncbi:hypothetical protein J2Z48_001758 [Croceifilum oryzae]|uniref:Uncharacterized protein n=1 Tax=Croceifilum oryzae TaxID=1553429 RepID=A0AAJ1TMT4_9BACL|nr:hypothetical protein [Croceifilum oryzae]MDQ0417585.1 hypothetical protein [Croceifilum oryzae]